MRHSTPPHPSPTRRLARSLGLGVLAAALAATGAHATPTTFGGYALGGTTAVADDATATAWGCTWDVRGTSVDGKVVELTLRTSECGDVELDAAVAQRLERTLTKTLGVAATPAASRGVTGWQTPTATVVLVDRLDLGVPYLALHVVPPQEVAHLACFGADGFADFMATFEASLAAKARAKTLAGWFAFPFSDETERGVEFKDRRAFIATAPKKLLRHLQRTRTTDGFAHVTECDHEAGEYMVHVPPLDFEVYLVAHRAPDGTWRFTRLSTFEDDL